MALDLPSIEERAASNWDSGESSQEKAFVFKNMSEHADVY